MKFEGKALLKPNVSGWNNKTQKFFVKINTKMSTISNKSQKRLVLMSKVVTVKMHNDFVLNFYRKKSNIFKLKVKGKYPIQ